jgi:class 3 adenylate cyclase
MRSVQLTQEAFQESGCEFLSDGSGEVYLISADLIGFSAMSQMIEESTDDAAEKLTRILRSLFSDITACVHRLKGQVLSFGGDSILVGWAATEAFEAIETAVLRDVSESIELTCRAASSLNLLDLRMRVSWAKARACWSVLERETGGVDRVIWGDVMNSWIQHHRPDFEGVASHHQMLWLEDAPLTGQTQSTRQEGLVDDGLQTNISGQAFVDSRIAATIVFIRFVGACANGDMTSAALKELANTLAVCVKKYGGFLSRIRFDDKGLNALVFWGIRHHSFEDDALRAVRVAQLVSSHEFKNACVGITSGRVFAATMGDQSAYEFTAMSSAVNNAAALATQAMAGQILCDQLTLQRLPAQRPVTPVSLRLKGHDCVQTFYSLSRDDAQKSRERSSPAPLPSNRPEKRNGARQNEVSAVLSQLAEKKSVLIAAEAGAGKTHLMTEVIRNWQGNGDAFLHIAFSADMNRGALRALLDAMAQWANEMAGQNREENEAVWRRFLAKQSITREQDQGILIKIIHWDIHSHEVNWQINAQVTQEKLESVVRLWIASVSETRKTLICLEDVHWIDEQSSVLMASIFSSVQTVVWLATSRLVQHEHSAPEKVAGIHWHSVHQLSPIDRKDVENMLEREFPHVRASELVIEDVLLITKGNPLFAKHWITEALTSGRYKKAAGWLVKTQQGASYGNSTHEPPISLHFLLQSQFDRLGDQQRLLAQFLSVLDQPISREQLAFFMQKYEVNSEAVEQCLRLHILNERTSTQAKTLSFNHSLMRDVAYSSLPLVDRQRLHCDVAQTMGSEQILQSDPLKVGWHWMKSDQGRVAVIRAVEAGHHALVTHSIPQALSFLGYAVQKIQNNASNYTPLEHQHASLLLAFAQSEVGKHQANRELILKTTRQQYTDQPNLALLISILSRHVFNIILGRFVQTGKQPIGSEFWKTQARAQLLLAEIAYFQGSIDDMQWHALCSLDASERSSALREQSATYGGFSLVFARFGLNWLSNQYAAAALKVARSSPDKINEVDALLYVCLRGVATADWHSTNWRLRRAFKRNEQSGHSRRRNELLIIEGYFFELQGNQPAALERYRECWKSGVERNDLQTTVWGKLGCSRTHLIFGQWPEAMAMLKDIAEDESLDKVSQIEYFSQRMAIAIILQHEDELDHLLRRWQTTDLSKFAQISFAYQRFLVVFLMGLIFKLTGCRDDRQKKILRADLAAAKSALKLHARQFLVSRPIAFLMEALWMACEHQHLQATKAIKASASLALSLGMRADAQRASSLELRLNGSQPQDSDCDYVTHIALRVFQKSVALPILGK